MNSTACGHQRFHCSRRVRSRSWLCSTQGRGGHGHYRYVTDNSNGGLLSEARSSKNSRVEDQLERLSHEDEVDPSHLCSSHGRSVAFQTLEGACHFATDETDQYCCEYTSIYHPDRGLAHVLCLRPTSGLQLLQTCSNHRLRTGIRKPLTTSARRWTGGRLVGAGYLDTTGPSFASDWRVELSRLR